MDGNISSLPSGGNSNYEHLTSIPENKRKQWNDSFGKREGRSFTEEVERGFEIMYRKGKEKVKEIINKSDDVNNIENYKFEGDQDSHPIGDG